MDQGGRSSSETNQQVYHSIPSHFQQKENFGRNESEEFDPPKIMTEEEWTCLYNRSDIVEMFKRETNINSSVESISFENGETPTCYRSWDGILCWPETLSGRDAILPCFSQLHGVHYNTSGEVNKISL